MSPSFISGSSASLRATGAARYFGTAFLSVWLAGWVVGETLALGFLVMLLRSAIGSATGASWPIPGGERIAGGAAGFVLLFLLLWLTLWTVGGVAAINELLRSLAGEDRVSVIPAGVELVRRAGPLRRVRTFERSRIRRVRLRHHDHAVVMDTAGGTELVTKYGTPDERRHMIEWLQRQLVLPGPGSSIDPVAAPPGWTISIEGGTTRLSRPDPKTRRIRAIVVWAIAALAGLLWFAATRTSEPAGVLVMSALTMLVTWWAIWTTWAHREWHVRQGRLTLHRRFATWQWERAFQSATLEVETSTDSDNDHRYELKVTDAQGAHTIASALHDDADIVDLGQWLAARTGFPLRLPRGMKAQSGRG